MNIKYEVLSVEEITTVHSKSLEILSEVGLKVFSNKMSKLLKSKGLNVDNDGVIKFDKETVEKAVERSNKNVYLYDYIGNKIKLENGNNLPAIYANAIKIYDYKTKKLRPSNSNDLINAMKLADSIPEIKLACPACLPGDIAVDNQLTYSIAKVMSLTTKPTFCAPQSAKESELWINSSKIAYQLNDGNEGNSLIFTVSPTSPLRVDEETCEVIIAGVENNVRMLISSCPMAGATSPMTMAGTAVLTHAEFLGMMTIVQTLKEGASVIYGGSAAPMNMMYGTLSYGVAERNSMLGANIDIANFFEFPHFSAAGSVNAVAPNIETGMSKALTWLQRLMKGTIMGLWFGSLANGTTISLEQTYMDAELFKMTKSMLNGIRINDDTLAMDAIKNVGIGGDYMMEEHTLKWIRSDEYYFSPIVNYMDVSGRGPLEIAHEEVEKILASYKSNVPDEIVVKLNEYLGIK